MLLIASSAIAQTQEYIREQHATFISKRDGFIKESIMETFKTLAYIHFKSNFGD
jgi:hypothetical protein